MGLSVFDSPVYVVVFCMEHTIYCILYATWSIRRTTADAKGIGHAHYPQH